jgi:predicted phosphodiesterase
MGRRIAIISDIHGQLKELKPLLEALSWISLDEIVSIGDIVDRGPDSGACVSLLREMKCRMVMGNHESSVINLHNKGLQGSPDKRRTIQSLTPDDWEFIKAAPRYLHYPDINTVVVHGGLWPDLPLEQQPHNVIRAQMIHTEKLTKVRWWGASAHLSREKTTEEQNRAEGWERWYRIYNLPYDVYYGHSCFAQPHIQRNRGAGLSVGIDTGGVFGGCLTAAIVEGGEPKFLSVKSERIYAEMTNRSFWEQ